VPADPAEARLARALRNASIAFFDSHPGGWRWSGAQFGIDGIDAADGRDRLIAAVSEADRPELQRLLSGDAAAGTGSAEFRIRSRAGGTLDLYCEARCEAGPDGAAPLVFGTVQDVTTQRRFEAELTEVVSRFHMLLATIDACPISITVADATQPGLPLIYVNRMFLQITGYALAEVIGRNCRFLQGAATERETVHRLRAAIAAGARAEVQITNYRRDGSTFLNRLTLAPYHDPTGRLNAYIGLQLDNTHEARTQEAEAQRQKMEALGRMMGGVAHEINNMLQPLTLLGQDLLDRGLVAADGRQHLDILLECTGRARAIIGDLLAFARPLPRRAEPHDPAALLTDALRLVQKALPPGLVLSVRIEARPCAVRMDRTSFTQILLNLATNAAAAMDGAGELVIVLDVDADPAAARLRVIDRGCGMDKTTLERAFEPFFTTKPVGQGTGLGLPMVYGLIRDMGGTIALDSEPGRGTTATILMPCIDGETESGLHPGD
jgi:PAS domain S-box-containing protein